MKKFFAALLAALMALSLVSIPVAAEGEVVFAAATVTDVEPGDSVSIPVTITGENFECHSMNMYVEFDTEVLTLDSAVEGSVISGATMKTLDTTSEPGKVKLGLLYATTGLSQSGELFTMNFTVSADAAEDIELPVTVITFANAPVGGDPTPIPYVTESGLIQLAGEEPPAGPTLDEALNIEGGPLHFENDATYPWEIIEEGGRIYAKSTNMGVANSAAAITFTYDAIEGDALVFDFISMGEGSDTNDWDGLRLYVDGSLAAKWGANHSEWETYTYELTAGEHTIEFRYKKDGSVNPTGDYACVDEVGITAGLVPPVTPEVTEEPTEEPTEAPTEEPLEGIIWDFETDPWAQGFTSIDADGDGNNWLWVYPASNSDQGRYHEGQGYIASHSYIIGTGGVHPDNWLLTPAFDGGTELHFWMNPYSNSYHSENVEVYVSTDGGETWGDPVWGMTLPGSNTPVEYTIDLSAYDGQTVTVAFRHYDTYDQWAVMLDYITVPGVEMPEPPVTPEPTEAPTEAPTEEPTVPPLVGIIWDFETDPIAQGFEFLDQDGDGYNWGWSYDGYPYYLYTYEGEGVAYSESYLNSYDPQKGALTPDNWMITPEFASDQIKFWTCAEDEDYADDYIGIYVSEDGGETWSDEVMGFYTPTVWEEKTVDLSAFSGTLRVAFRHYNCTDQYIALIDYITVPQSEPPVDEPITLVEINDFVIPEWNAEPFYACTVPDDAHYYISQTVWLKDDVVMTSEELFDDANAEYRQVFIVTPYEGYYFPEEQVFTKDISIDDITVLINGTEDLVGLVEENGQNSGNIAVYTVPFTVTPPSVDEVEFYVEPFYTVSYIGDTVYVSVMVNGEFEAHTLNLQFNYDPAAFALSEIFEGTVLANVADNGGSYVLDTNTVPGSVRVGVIMPNDPFTEDGELFTVALTVTDDAVVGTEYPLELEVTEFRNFPLGGEPTDIPYFTQDGAVEIIDMEIEPVEFEVTAPSPVTRGSTFTANVNVYGVYEAHGLTMAVTYDDTAFEATGVTPGEILQQVTELGGTYILDYETNPGVISLGIMMPDAGFDLSGDLFDIEFTVKDDAATGIYDLDPVVDEFRYFPLGMDEGIDIPYEEIPAEVEIIDIALFTVTSPEQVERGEVFPVVVTLTGEYPEAHGLTFSLEYDASVFEVVGDAEYGDILNAALGLGAAVIIDTETIPGSVRLGVMMPEEGFTGEGTLFTVNFRAKDDAPAGLYDFDPVVTEFRHFPLDGEGMDIPYETINDQTEIVDVVTPEPTDEPTPEPTDEPTPEPTDEPTPEPTDEPT
ncbi:MAG: choice-of-anchor J domain-containing protein, partial [Clostridia bacterium]|nr:choice-of-anchor J domain-containing protein [Clostridia bacterium]